MTGTVGEDRKEQGANLGQAGEPQLALTRSACIHANQMRRVRNERRLDKPIKDNCRDHQGHNQKDGCNQAVSLLKFL